MKEKYNWCLLSSDDDYLEKPYAQVDEYEGNYQATIYNSVPGSNYEYWSNFSNFQEAKEFCEVEIRKLWEEGGEWTQKIATN